MAANLVQITRRGMGETMRRDLWWLQPVLTFLGLGAFVVYSTWAAFQGEHYTYESAYPGSDEKRFVAIGLAKGRIVAVIHTLRKHCIRVISIRRARYDEKETYRSLYG